MSMNGIDISNHQKGLDVSKVPCDFVIMKATEGTTFVDKYCDGFYQQAKRIGKKLGVYHFASGKSSGTAEADFFLKNIDGKQQQQDEPGGSCQMPGGKGFCVSGS